MPDRDAEAYLLVVDIEATCWADQMTPEGEPQSIFNMEIIELGCALANRQGRVLDTQTFLVRPTRNPILSEFCTALTGITQPMMDSAPAFPDAVEALNRWVQPIGPFIWCSWGNYDRLHISAQSAKCGVLPILLHHSHLNLKKAWRRTTGQRKSNGLVNALAFHGLTFEGSNHRGIDDARNAVRLLPLIDWNFERELLTPPAIRG
ncbi:3'-5' exonuclease [Pseudomonas sp. NyZ704]|nr:3'-5' exonuclease [Pseudomonas sp. NyZ704]